MIQNNGSSRATDISIEIEIPDGLEIYETVDMDMLTRVSIPNHKRPGDRHKYEAELPGLRKREYREDYHEKLISLPSINGWDIVENKAEISIDEIRHYNAKRSTDFFVTATKPGRYKLLCSVMCAEYKEPDVQELIIDVVKAR